MGITSILDGFNQLVRISTAPNFPSSIWLLSLEVAFFSVPMLYSIASKGRSSCISGLTILNSSSGLVMNLTGSCTHPTNFPVGTENHFSPPY